MWSQQTDRAGLQTTASASGSRPEPGLILYAFTISFAAIDWVMSLDPTWIPNIFGLIILMGKCFPAMLLPVVVERIPFRLQTMSELLKPNFRSSITGKWMMTFNHGLGIFFPFRSGSSSGRAIFLRRSLSICGGSTADGDLSL